MAETIHKKQAWLDEMAAIVQRDINTLEVLQRARKLNEKESNFLQLCSAYMYLYKMAELKEFLSPVLSEDEDETNFETIH